MKFMIFTSILENYHDNELKINSNLRYNVNLWKVQTVLPTMLHKRIKEQMQKENVK